MNVFEKSALFAQQNDTLILEELVGDRLEEEEVERRGEEQEVGEIYLRLFLGTL